MTQTNDRSRSILAQMLAGAQQSGGVRFPWAPSMQNANRPPPFASVLSAAGSGGPPGMGARGPLGGIFGPPPQGTPDNIFLALAAGQKGAKNGRR